MDFRTPHPGRVSRFGGLLFADLPSGHTTHTPHWVPMPTICLPVLLGTFLLPLARLAAAVSAGVSAGSAALFPAAVAAVASLVEGGIVPGGGCASTEIKKKLTPMNHQNELRQEQ